jgi:hypothetical protein
MRIREIAQARVRYGYRKIRVLLNREGWDVGKYLVYRLYHLFISRKSLRDENCRAAKMRIKWDFRQRSAASIVGKQVHARPFAGTVPSHSPDMIAFRIS